MTDPGPARGVDRSDPTSIAVIIPTVGRESLDRAVLSVLGQGPGVSFEVIVVNDSGAPLPGRDWQSNPLVRMLETNRRERGAARNAGAEAARRKYLLFLDDDDWLAPDALGFLLEGVIASGSKLVYGATRLVDRKGRPIIDLSHGLSGNLACQVMCGEWIPLQSLAIDRVFFRSIGAFHHWQAGSEDIDLVRRAAVESDFHYIPEIISSVGMGQAGSTTDRDRQRARGRKGRELILDQPDAFRRMRSSATAPRWSGGIVRIYLTSALWNLARLRLLRAARRLFYAAAAFLRSGRHILDSAFWTAIVRPYRSVTFERGLSAAGRPSS